MIFNHFKISTREKKKKDRLGGGGISSGLCTGGEEDGEAEHLTAAGPAREILREKSLSFIKCRPRAREGGGSPGTGPHQTCETSSWGKREGRGNQEDAG